MDTTGSWDESLTIEFTENDFSTALTKAVILGDTHYVKATLSVSENPIGQTAII